MKIKFTLLVVATVLVGSLYDVCAQSQEEIRNSLSYPIDDIEKAKAQVESYAPGKQAYLVDLASRDWLKRALSMKRREQWITETNFWNAFGPETPAKKKMLYEAFDALRAAADKKMPSYLPQAKLFAFKNNAELELMKEKINDFREIKKIHNIGTQQNSWLIAKDDYNLPLSRYKQGYMWVYYGPEASGHPYCVLFNVNVIQDYAGAGTYGESYGSFVSAEICGCPK